MDASAGPVGRGGWVYLPADFARQHPLYGPNGWAWLLLLFLFVGPIVLLLQDFRIVAGGGLKPELFWIVLVAEAIFGILCWITGLKLGREREDFPGFFYLTAAVGLVCALLFFYVLLEGLPRDYEDRAMFGFLWRAVPIAVWTIYVWRSKRINVTTLKRVTSRDPFLRSQWLSNETPAGSVSQTRRRSLFARPFRKIPVVAARPADSGEAGAMQRTAAREPVPEFAPRQPDEREHGSSEVHRGPAVEVAQRSERERIPLRRPASPVGDRYYIPRRSVPTAVAVEPMSRPSEAVTAMPDRARRQRIENALVLDRLRRLQIAHEEGLISHGEMTAKRAELLNEL